MNWKTAVLAILFIFATLLALGLKDYIWDSLVVPIQYRLWLTWIFLRSMPQIVYWNSLVIMIAIIALVSLMGRRHRTLPPDKDAIPTQDPVSKLSKKIQDTHKGTFFKWLVANHLGALARSILIHQHGEQILTPRSLKGRDWNPPEDVQAYLEAGLARSFIEQPRRWLLFKSRKTSLNIDINRVVAYLESQMEIDIEH